MSDNIFIDSNIWIYAYDLSDKTRQEISCELIAKNSDDIVISTQNLGEIYNTLTRKQITSTSQAFKLIEQLINTFDPVPIQANTVYQALTIATDTILLLG